MIWVDDTLETEQVNKVFVVSHSDNILKLAPLTVLEGISMTTLKVE